MINLKVFAGGRIKALPVLADSGIHLLVAGCVPEIGGGPPHIMDVSLEPGVIKKQPRLPDY